uniref:Reverse transcriptase domain-containing protein n=1 Tax=Podarcis muralis TaxID=64176 RepID=A0A670HKH7_PODMU
MDMRLTPTGSFRWKMNDTLLRDQEIIQKAQKTLKDYFEINLNTTVEKRVIWDASKAVMRGFLIQQNTIKKRAQNEKKDKILEKIKECEKKLRSKPKSQEILREIKLYQAQYSKLINQEVEWKIKLMKQRTFESANKCGKLLAWQLKKRQKLNTVTNLEIEGRNIQNPVEIRKCFQRYFKQLYMQGPQKETEIDQFLRRNGLPKLSQENRTILNYKITQQEIEGAIQNMQLGKSPGPDGLTSKYYKTLKDYLTQPLMEVCNEIMEGKKAPESWKEAFITLIPKSETENTQLKNYRPIYLLNVDYKIFANILANRFKRVLNEVIHKDQAGFLPGRHLFDNTRNIIDILELLQTNINTKAVLIFIDAEKAFDNISWKFMKKNLEGMGVGRGFENGIDAIYSEQFTQERGGFALPDLRLYYESAAFCWLKDWLLLENTDVLDLEGFNNAFGWHAYLWYDKVIVHKAFKNHIVRKAILNVWIKYKDLLENKTPRWLSPMEAKARKRLSMEAKWPKYWEILEKVGDTWRLQSFEKLKDKVRDWLHYAQIREVFNLDKKTGFQVEKSKLETELLEPKTKVLSKMYNLLLKWNTQDETVKSAMIKWAQDIGYNIMFADWERLWTTGVRFTACNALKENIMKMIYRWYMTPVKLAKIYHLPDNKCWKCKGTEGTFFHLWWTCPRVKAFWEMIYNELKKVFKYTFPKKPEAFLLGMVGQRVLKKD